MMFFDAEENKNEFSGDNTVVKPGEYIALVEKCEVKQAQNSPGCEYINVQYRILGPSYVNKCLFKTFMWKGYKEEVLKRAKGQFSDLCLSCQVPRPKGPQDLVNKKVVIKVTVTKRKDTGEEENNCFAMIEKSIKLKDDGGDDSSFSQVSDVPF